MIIKCPECGREVSDRAGSCPGCGYPIAGSAPRKRKMGNLLAEGKKKLAALPADKKKKLALLGVVAVVCVAVLLVLFGSRCGLKGCRNRKTAGSSYCATHTCAQAGCNSFAPDGSLYCSRHTENTGPLVRPSEDGASVLKISNVKVTSNTSYQICTGTVTNNGTSTYSFVKVKGAFEDSRGKVLDTDWTYAVGSEGLEPGESTTFRLSVDKNYSIKTCSVTILDYDKD